MIGHGQKGRRLRCMRRETSEHLADFARPRWRSKPQVCDRCASAGRVGGLGSDVDNHSKTVANVTLSEPTTIRLPINWGLSSGKCLTTIPDTHRRPFLALPPSSPIGPAGKRPRSVLPKLLSGRPHRFRVPDIRRKSSKHSLPGSVRHKWPRRTIRPASAYE